MRTGRDRVPPHGAKDAMIPSALLATLLAPAPPAEAPAPRAVHTLAAGPRYAASGFKRFLFGSHYRDLWTTPIRVEVLDLGGFSGGLTPTKRGGGKQTAVLHFEAADGRKWKVRSVDKDPTPVLPEELRDTFAVELVRDQTSAAHPAGALIVDALAEAAGLLHVKHRLVVLPDDPRLGEFRKEFAGMLVVLEENPSPKLPPPGFEDHEDIVETDDLWERLDANPGERVDLTAYLKARLFDMVVGDFDRHEDQWDWARRKGGDRWVPIPKDRDQVFAKYDGLLISLVQPGQGRLVDFTERYPSIRRLTWQGRILDRRLLPELPWSAWEPVIAELQGQLSDAAIDAAMKRQPPEYERLEGGRLAARLRARRDALPDAARRFYELLCEEAEIHLTDEADRVTVQPVDGAVEVKATDAEGGVRFVRRFLPAETRQIRFFLKGGDDQLAVVGEPLGIDLRVVGGEGADTIDDDTAGALRVYDAEGENRIARGEGTHVDDRPYVQPRDDVGMPLRDWGRSSGLAPWVRAGGDLGVLVGLEWNAVRYGFRRHPYSTRHAVRAGYATGLSAWQAEYAADLRRTNSPNRGRLFARVSELDRLRFHGFGNETEDPEDGRFYHAAQRQYSLAALYEWNPGPLTFGLGPVAKFSTTELAPDRFVTVARPYGSDDFGQVGARARLAFDTRDLPRAARRGVFLEAVGSVYPAAWGAEESFGELRGQAATYLGAGNALTLALRAGGEHAFGRYPFQEAAYVGGPDTIRGLRPQRYAGDAALFGNAELRLRLGRAKVLVPADLGVFGLFDVGRVFLDGESSDRWHRGVGGGVWIAFLRPANTIAFTAARAEGRTRFYLTSGFGF